MSDHELRRLLSVRQAAEYLGLSVKTLYTWSEGGRLAVVRLGSRVLFDLRELDRLIERNIVTAERG